MFKHLLLLVAALLLSSCAAIQPTISKLSFANDAAIAAAELTICQAASIGSIQRRFNTPELAQAWKIFCSAQKQLP
jgi:uncharacterized lipoprotein YajG